MNSVTNRAFMAKKKMYNNPKTEIMDVMPMSIICYSGEIGDTNDPITGQAPARRGESID